MPVAGNSTVPRRQLGRQLRTLRENAGLTVKVAAEALELAPATLWRLETGRVATRSLNVRLMCELYRVDSTLTDALVALAKEAKSRGWWHSYSDVLPEWLDLYVGLEQAASRIDWYGPELIPGLMQTREYARVVFTTARPEASTSEIDRLVELRMGRRAALQREADPPELRVVLNEAVLHRAVSSRTHMAIQLRSMLEMGRLPNVAIRVVPFSAGLHTGALTGNFVALRFTGPEAEPPTVYTEGYVGSAYLEKPVEIQQYDSAFSRLWNVASEEDTTRQLIESKAKEFDHD